MFYQFNTIPLKPIHNTISLWTGALHIVWLKKNIFKLHTKGNHLMNNRKKMSSQESNISGFIDVLGNRHQRIFSLALKAPLYHEQDSLIFFLWVNTICKSLLSRFTENLLLPRIFGVLYTVLITSNDSLKILCYLILIGISPGQSFSNIPEAVEKSNNHAFFNIGHLCLCSGGLGGSLFYFYVYLVWLTIENSGLLKWRTLWYNTIMV